MDSPNPVKGNAPDPPEDEPAASVEPEASPLLALTDPVGPPDDVEPDAEVDAPAPTADDAEGVDGDAVVPAVVALIPLEDPCEAKVMFADAWWPEASP